MIFSSIPFLYYFLPITLLLYFITPKKHKNKTLLISSIFFYYYGEQKYIFLLLFSSVFNYYMSKMINQKKSLLIFTLLINFALLFYFKYTNFFIENINKILNTNIKILQIGLPIGISFYTFQATSYIIDVYKKKIEPAKNIWEFATYLTLFPQLIAGPIVRYEEIAKEIKERQTTWKDTEKGLTRFIIGLAKKVIIANLIGEFILSLKTIQLTTIVSSWLQAISYTLQIYFDFSAYSDMAIGLGLIFGFHFKENFNYPLTAKSITDFWRKWHISLSSWFKEYLYIPLGGSKKGTKKTIRNLFIVWITTGLWHGANWNFIIWGLYFGILLILEKFLLKKFLENHKFLAHISTLIMIIIGFIIFSIEAKEIIPFIKNMIGLNHLPFINFETIFYFKNYIILFLIAIIGSTPIVKKLYLKGKEKWKGIEMIEPILLGTLLIITTAFIIDESYNPFLYFRF